MCGICGIVHSGATSIDISALERMNNAVRHRGPDGEGFYRRSGVGLAMRRLAIIDLNTGDQPIANEDETIWIVFNGEIYNFPDLRKELEQRGHHFRTRTDTECIVHLYEDFGPDCVSHLRGMFAFAIWEERQSLLMIARDRLGQKPLYYTVQDGCLCFSSELPSLLLSLPQRPSLNLQAIDFYLSLQYIPEPLTAYEGIYKLLPAHRLIWREGEYRIERYWDLSYESKLTATEGELAEELRQRVRQAVQMRLISDVPLGAHLSGGIDSSVVVALMAEASSTPVKTFTANFEEASFSEVEFARKVAQRYSTDHHEFVLAYKDVPATIETILRHVGEPFADPSALPLYYLSRLTREHVTVALNGDGGDETFAGYQRYWLDPWANRYLRLPLFITRRMIPNLVRRFPDRSDQPVGQSVINGLKRLGQIATVDQRASILRWGSYFPSELKLTLWRPAYREELKLGETETFLLDRFKSAPARSYLDRTLYTDITTYLPGDLLVKADRMTMATSLEGRSPFLDHELMGWAARLPEHLRVHRGQGKVLLRKAFSDYLPPRVLERGKQGFGVPVGAWLRGPLSNWARDIVAENLSGWFDRVALLSLFDEHIKGHTDHGKRLWALVVLGMWLSIGVDIRDA
jgi:asparagine synthase (glutamine-hydrolysing)